LLFDILLFDGQKQVLLLLGVYWGLLKVIKFLFLSIREDKTKDYQNYLWSLSEKVRPARHSIKYLFAFLGSVKAFNIVSIILEGFTCDLIDLFC